MRLTEVQREFICKQLKVEPKSKSIFSYFSKPTEKEAQDESLSNALEKYLLREKEVFEPLRALEKIEGMQGFVDECEDSLEKIQKTVKEASREEGDNLFEQSFKELEGIGINA